MLIFAFVCFLFFSLGLRFYNIFSPVRSLRKIDAKRFKPQNYKILSAFANRIFYTFSTKPHIGNRHFQQKRKAMIWINQ